MLINARLTYVLIELALQPKPIILDIHFPEINDAGMDSILQVSSLGTCLIALTFLFIFLFFCSSNFLHLPLLPLYRT